MGMDGDSLSSIRRLGLPDRLCEALGLIVSHALSMYPNFVLCLAALHHSQTWDRVTLIAWLYSLLFSSYEKWKLPQQGSQRGKYQRRTRNSHGISLDQRPIIWHLESNALCRVSVDSKHYHVLVTSHWSTTMAASQQALRRRRCDTLSHRQRHRLLQGGSYHYVRNFGRILRTTATY